MTDTLHVRRLDVRYRVAADDPVVRARLDALLARVLDHDLEPALVEHGLPVGEEICVRDVHVPARVRLATEAAAAEVLSAAIADGIAATIARGGAGVVRYRSHRAALVDVALSVATGRLDRAWAWRRIGLWRGGDGPAPRDAAAELAATLAGEPEAVVAVLAEVARARALPRLVELIADDEWSALARAALAAGGAPGAVAAIGVEARRSTTTTATAAARRAARESAIAAAARASARPLSTEKAIALAALAWLEVEPAAAGAADVVGEIARQLALPERPATTEDEASPEPAAADIDAHPTDSFDDVFVPALTRFGGLLFLLGVLDGLGVPAEAQRSPTLGGRPLRWTLHRLALTLVAVDPDDPAALAFAGLPPNAEPPSDDDRPETEDERLALGVLAARVTAQLRERLDLPDATSEELLDFVCRRRGEIAFDPGWCELRLPVDEISVELRRAGLDLDPGWVPWLGCVVRFVYG